MNSSYKKWFLDYKNCMETDEDEFDVDILHEYVLEDDCDFLSGACILTHSAQPS